MSVLELCPERGSTWPLGLPDMRHALPKYAFKGRISTWNDLTILGSGMRQFARIRPRRHEMLAGSRLPRPRREGIGWFSSLGFRRTRGGFWLPHAKYAQIRKLGLWKSFSGEGGATFPLFFVRGALLLPVRQVDGTCSCRRLLEGQPNAVTGMDP
jgi:hypothetical protein